MQCLITMIPVENIVLCFYLLGGEFISHGHVTPQCGVFKQNSVTITRPKPGTMEMRPFLATVFEKYLNYMNNLETKSFKKCNHGHMT